MNTPGLFIVGACVTLIVLSALALLIYGAVLDGREEAAAQEADDDLAPPARHSPAHAR